MNRINFCKEKHYHRESPEGHCMSGCENLFFNPAIYRRVRYLTARCQAFIVPGILNEMDVLVACELKMAIFGNYIFIYIITLKFRSCQFLWPCFSS